MKENKRIRQTQFIRWTTPLLVFLIANFLLRYALIWVNEAEYTDGIIQVTQFAEPSGIYPPLYTALTWPFAFLVGPLWAGRFISCTFSALAVIPLYLMARRSFGLQSALFTALLYTVHPEMLRWAPRLMTESTFAFFFWFSCERLLAAQRAKSADESNSALMLANIFGTLAALTRYQGMLLILPVLAIAFAHHRFWKFVPWKGILSLGFYVLVPLWSLFSGNIHGTQFSERAGSNVVMTTILNAEAFLLLLPYYMTYPVAALAIMGLCKGRSRPRLMMKPLTFYVLLILLIAQGAFGSFQERYMMPAMGLLLIWGGVGLAVTNNILRRTAPRVRPYIPIVSVVWCCFFTVFVIMGSREAFGDMRRGAELAARMVQPGQTIYSNEIYRESRTDRGEARIATNKVRFYAKKPVTYLSPEYYTGVTRLKPGDLVILSSAYGLEEAAAALGQFYELEQVGEFRRTVTPIFCDIMAEPGTGQNPAAWLYRYTPQPFATRVYQVAGPRR